MGLTRTHRILGTLLSAGLPVAYMVGLHLTWTKDRNSRMRMAFKHLGFWGGMAGTLYIAHRYGFRAKTLPKAFGIWLGASVLPVLGYEVMRRIAARCFPKSSRPSEIIGLSTKSSEASMTPMPGINTQVVEGPMPDNRVSTMQSMPLMMATPGIPYRPGMPPTSYYSYGTYSRAWMPYGY